MTYKSNFCPAESLLENAVVKCVNNTQKQVNSILGVHSLKEAARLAEQKERLESIVGASYNFFKYYNPHIQGFQNSLMLESQNYIKHLSKTYSDNFSACFKQKSFSLDENILIGDGYVDISNDVFKELDSISEVPKEEISTPPNVTNFVRLTIQYFLVTLLPVLLTCMFSYYLHQSQSIDSDIKHEKTIKILEENNKTMEAEKELLLQMYLSLNEQYNITQEYIENLEKHIDSGH